MGNRRNGLKPFLDFIIWLISSNVFQQLIHFIFSVITPFCVLSSNNEFKWLEWLWWTSQLKFFSVLSIYIFFLVLFGYVNHKKNKNYEHLNFSESIRSELINVISSYNKFICGSPNEAAKESFTAVSQLICNSIYNILSNSYDDREFRVSVVKQFSSCNSGDRNGYFYFTAGFKTKFCSQGNTVPKSVKKCNKYIKHILTSDKEHYIILDEHQILEKFTKDKIKDTSPKSYIALPYMGNFNKICFVLQIDSSASEAFGKNNQEIVNLIEFFFSPFMRILESSYLIDWLNFSDKRGN